MTVFDRRSEPARRLCSCGSLYLPAPEHPERCARCSGWACLHCGRPKTPERRLHCGRPECVAAQRRQDVKEAARVADQRRKVLPIVAAMKGKVRK